MKSLNYQHVQAFLLLGEFSFIILCSKLAKNLLKIP